MATPFRVLLLAGGALAAGALFAGVTSRSMEPYRHQSPASLAAQSSPSTIIDAADGTEPSWLDRGFAVFGAPAWPFGREQWRGSDAEAQAREDWRDDPDYAPDHPRWADDDAAYGHDGSDDQGDDFHDSDADGVEPGQPGYSDRTHPEGGSGRSDSAAEAAARAREAAQDVLAAENGN